MTAEIDRAHSLSVPFTILDAWEHDAEAMASEGVLTRDEGLVAFEHQAFFDYAFARRFVATGDDVVTFLTSGGQQLFQRAQLREILIHVRDIDRSRFLETLREVLERADVRFHLKDAALALLVELDNPTSEEWRLVRDQMQGRDDEVAARLRGIIGRRGEWFDLAANDGWLASEVASSDPNTAANAITIVGRAQRNRPSTVAELLSPYVGVGGDWPNRLAYVVRLGDLTLDRSFLELVLRAIAAGDLDAMPPFAMNGTFWDEAYAMARTKPPWAAEFARAYLDRRMALGGAEEARHTVENIPDPMDREFFSRIGAQAPSEYLRHLLPWILEIADATTRVGGSRYDSFSARWPGDPSRLTGGLLAGAEQAFRALADADETLDEWRALLVASKSETANFLLLRLGMAAPVSDGPIVAQALVDRPSRLQAAIGADYHWATREFLLATTPGLEQGLRDELQRVILAYYPEWERTPRGKASYGHAQWVLLSAFPEAALVEESRRRIRELRHKFGDASPKAPAGIQVSRIGSPIPDDVADQVTDEQWLGALSKYTADVVRWDRPLERGGGLHQLAQTLYAQTMAHPRRFAKLSLQFPDDVPSRYVDDVLRGLAETSVEIPLDEVLAVCRRAHALPGNPCGRWIVDVIGKRAHEELDEGALDLVAWYAMNAVDPDNPSRPVSGDDMSEADRIDSHALNCDRGRALLAIADLVRGNAERLEPLRRAISAGAADPIDAVRAAAAEALLASLRHDPELVAQTLRTLISDMPDALLASRSVSRLISHYAQTDFANWRDVLDRMKLSADPRLLRLSASIAALASFLVPEAQAMVDEALAGAEAERLGVADVAAANVAHHEFGPVAEAWANELFTDDSADVRREAANSVAGLSADAVGNHQTLFRAFLASPAFDDNPGLFFHRVADSASLPAELELEACERYVHSAKGAAGDIRTAASASAGDVSRIAVRAHDQGAEATREKALDVIDGLLMVGAFGIEEAIGNYER